MKEQNLGAAQRKNIQILGLCLVICVIFALGAVFLRAPASVGIVDWETVHTYGDSSQEHTKIGVQTIRVRIICSFPPPLRRMPLPSFLIFRNPLRCLFAVV